MGWLRMIGTSRQGTFDLGQRKAVNITIQIESTAQCKKRWGKTNKSGVCEPWKEGKLRFPQYKIPETYDECGDRLARNCSGPPGSVPACCSYSWGEACCGRDTVRGENNSACESRLDKGNCGLATGHCSAKSISTCPDCQAMIGRFKYHLGGKLDDGTVIRGPCLDDNDESYVDVKCVPIPDEPDPVPPCDEGKFRGWCCGLNEGDFFNYKGHDGKVYRSSSGVIICGDGKVHANSGVPHYWRQVYSCDRLTCQPADR